MLSSPMRDPCGNTEQYMAKFDSDYTAKFYDVYGDLEWERLEATPYGRLQATIHAEFIERYMRLGDRVLDAGCGPGRFTAVAAQLGATVTALDISERQLALAKQRVSEANMLDRVDGFVRADISDLSMFPNDYFDVVVCYGGALSYVCDQRYKATSELVRVVRPGGVLLISVMSRLGTICNLVRRATMTVLRDPEAWHVSQVAETGDNPGFPSAAVNMQHPPMHMYTSGELRNLLPGCSMLELAGSNVTTFEGSAALSEVATDTKAWETAVNLERRMNAEPGLADTGSHIILVARRER